MQYLGGKTRIAKDIAEQIRKYGKDCTRYVEPFMGGASVLAAAAPAFDYVYASDTCLDLVLFWAAAADGWIPPETVTEEEYLLAKDSPSSRERGFIGFGCSFGGKWFGGYARDNKGRNYALNCRNSSLKKASKFKHAVFSCHGYERVLAKEGVVIYCDPPYRGTTGYAATGTFCHDRFYRQCEDWVRMGAIVLVSEYTAPASWECVWEKEHISYVSGMRGSVEKLFLVKEAT